MNILIVGAGKTGSYLAEQFSKDHTIAIIEQRADRAAMVRRMVPDATVIAGDACEPDVLERINVSEIDLVAAVTGDDEDNLVVAMLAKLYDAKTVYARVNHPANYWLFDKEWGVDVPVSSPQLMYGLIDKDLGLGDLITLLKLKAEGVFLKEITLPSRATAVGKTLREIGLPPNVTVVAILSATGNIKAPRGDTTLIASDQLLFLVEGPLEDSVIRDAFGVADADLIAGVDPAVVAGSAADAADAGPTAGADSIIR